MKPEDLINYDGPDRVVHWTEFLAMKKKIGQTAKKFNIGFPWLNKGLDGVQTGDVIVVTGHRKNGKTLFTNSLVRNLATHNDMTSPVVFYFETQPEELMKNYPTESPPAIYLPLQLKCMDFGWLYDRCIEAKLKHDSRIILIDHLHYMVDMATSQNMSLNIGAFMRRLKKDIAIDLNMSVILIAHQGMSKDGKEASGDNMRDSSFIGQEADTTIVVSRAKNLDEVELSDFEKVAPPEKIDILRKAHGELRDLNDDFSAGLCIVRIEDNRRTGYFKAKKLYIKQGEFLEEL